MKSYTISRRNAKKMVGPGWSKILDKLYDLKPRYVHVMQVKEKFGGLRFYVGGAPNSFLDAIDAAEEESYKTCERCGKEGKLRDDLGWMLTLCDEHYQETIENNKRGRTVTMQVEGWKK